MTETATRFITRQEIIEDIGIGAYKSAVASKKLKIYRFGTGRNCKQSVKRKEYEAFVETCRQE